MGIRVISGDSVYLLKPDLLGKGETARVFPAYLAGEGPAQTRWAIKLAKNQQYNTYIEHEHDTLTKLHQVMSSLPKTKRS
jgi:hypothetical protein